MKLVQCIPNDQVQEVCKIPISLAEGKDKLIWKNSKSGDYTVKSGYALKVASIPRVDLLKPSCSFIPESAMWKRLWGIPTLPKIKMFMWKVLRNWVACRANLVKRKCGSNPNCPICEHSVETMEHILFHCPWSKAVWFGSSKASWVLQKEVVAVDKWMEDLLCGELAKITTKEDMGVILQICWAIWKARNNFVFNNKLPMPEEVIEQALSMNRDYLSAVCSKVSALPVRPVGVMKWEPPPPSWTKINSDGAFTSSRSLAAFGIIARDSGGKAQWWQCGRVVVASALSIEAWALRVACVMAKEANLNEVIFESDCKALINCLCESSADIPWMIATIVEDIKVWASNRRWKFKWCRRECNRGAHWIAANGRYQSFAFSTGCIPPELESILCKDLL